MTTTAPEIVTAPTGYPTLTERKREEKSAAKLLTWWQVLDYWRLAVLGDRGTGRPNTPGRRSGPSSAYRPISEQCRGYLETVKGFDDVRADLRRWALDGVPLQDETILWAVRVLRPAMGKGLAVLPPEPPQGPPPKDLNNERTSLRDRLK